MAFGPIWLLTSKTLDHDSRDTMQTRNLLHKVTIREKRVVAAGKEGGGLCHRRPPSQPPRLQLKLGLRRRHDIAKADRFCHAKLLYNTHGQLGHWTRVHIRKTFVLELNLVRI